MEAQFRVREPLFPPRSLTFRLVCIMKKPLSFRVPRLRGERFVFWALGNIALFLSIGENRFITDLWRATSTKAVSEKAREGFSIFASGCADEFAFLGW